MTAIRARRHGTAPDRRPPLADSFGRLHAVLPDLRIRIGPPRSGRGWTALAGVLADPVALGDLIAFDTRATLRDHGTEPRPDVAAGFCLHRYLWPAALAFTAPWFLERRVPRIRAERVSVNRSTGGLTVEVDGFACLPGDPEAHRPDARPVADRAALRAELRSALAEHLTPVIAAFRPATRRGSRTLWGMATDDVVGGLWQLGGLLGEEDRAAAELAELFPEPAATGPGRAGPGSAGTDRTAARSPFVGGAGFLTEQGRRTRNRTSCCLFYTVRPEELCAGCPRAQ
ncbi:(2Fe-2S)-binding protein [Kitasatospora camelliae]|uniref:(2Fe-2S)-binding protein n=1 Tax=Kitasatospora camelliae TaxID=3156397 RepID=A0AAU8JUU2_9ACTN